MVILGIDPGSVRIGFGVIEKEGRKLSYITSGLLKIPERSAPEGLVAAEKDLVQILKKTKPNLVGLEKLFFSSNKKTAFSVSEARGVILLTITKRAVPVQELTPTEVKLALTGSGRASKVAVARMVLRLLKLQGGCFDDVTDALALAIAVSHNTWVLD